jgi:hypothetical protein
MNNRTFSELNEVDKNFPYNFVHVPLCCICGFLACMLCLTPICGTLYGRYLVIGGKNFGRPIQNFQILQQQYLNKLNPLMVFYKDFWFITTMAIIHAKNGNHW